MEQREMTRGEKLVGINFNVGGSDAVAECKKRFAEAIDQLDAHRDDELNRGTLNAIKDKLIGEAESRIIDAQMWAVKALTYGK